MKTSQSILESKNHPGESVFYCPPQWPEKSSMKLLPLINFNLSGWFMIMSKLQSGKVPQMEIKLNRIRMSCSV